MRRAITKLVLFLCAWAWMAASAVAAETWSFEAFLGDAHSLRSPLKVEQDGGFSRSFSADYDTRGFESPLYYSLRGGRWNEDRGWEISLIHQKLYVQNPPAGVASLSISHGFNIVTVNRAFRNGDWTYRFGAGPVITHAEGGINGVTYDGSYDLSGAALLAGGGRRFYLGKTVFVSLEGAVTAGYARPHLDGPPDARINATNIGFHGLAGLGIDLQ